MLPECHNDSADMIVLVDEGHRSQGGENHERMRQTLPKASYIAFTGTPLLYEERRPVAVLRLSMIGLTTFRWPFRQ